MGGVTYLLRFGRNIADFDFASIVKDNTLTLHSIGTNDVYIRVAPDDDYLEMSIYGM